MSSQSIQKKVEALTAEMVRAAEAEDFERAAALRNEIETLTGPSVRKPPPGQMGLGTNIPVAAPPKGWTPPKKPSPMTRNFKPGGRR